MRGGPPDGDFEFTLPSDREVEALRLTLEEARSTLTDQQQSLSDMDDKAMRSVRITLLTLGILLSAATFPQAAQFINILTVLGAASLTLSILAGVITYSVSRVEHGPGSDYFVDIRENAYTEEEWLELLLAGYEEMCTTMADLNVWERRLMASTLLFLALGVVLVTVGIYSAFSGHVVPMRPAIDTMNGTPGVITA